MMMKLLQNKTDSDHNVETAQTEPQPSTSGVQENEDPNATAPTTNSTPNKHQGKEEAQSQQWNNAPETDEDGDAEIDDLLQTSIEETNKEHSESDTEEITEDPTKYYSEDKHLQNNLPKANHNLEQVPVSPTNTDEVEITRI